jgi:hypothetical protein
MAPVLCSIIFCFGYSCSACVWQQRRSCIKVSSRFDEFCICEATIQGLFTLYILTLINLRNPTSKRLSSILPVMTKERLAGVIGLWTRMIMLCVPQQGQNFFKLELIYLTIMGYENSSYILSGVPHIVARNWYGAGLLGSTIELRMTLKRFKSTERHTCLSS